MSHVVEIALQIGTDADSLAAVKQVCKELGLIFKQGQQTYRWYGRSVGDYPIPAGFTAEDLGRCDHAIECPGATYDIGLARRKDGKPGYTMLFDFYCQPKLLEAIGGQKANKFVQLYGVARAEIAAKKLGATVRREIAKNGTINVIATGGRI